MKKLTVTRLLVSERSSEGFDCLSRSMEHNNMKKKCNKKFQVFFVKTVPHTPYKVQSDFAPSNKSIMVNKLTSTYLEEFLKRIKSPLTS